GITGQIMSRFGAKANTGIGYAIPVDQIQRFYPLLKAANGHVVYHSSLQDGLNFSTHPDDTQTATIELVDPGSAAETAGFRTGDKVLTVDGKTVFNFARLNGIVRSYPENATVEVGIERAGRRTALQVKLPRMPLPPTPGSAATLGVKGERP